METRNPDNMKYLTNDMYRLNSSRRYQNMSDRFNDGRYSSISSITLDDETTRIIRGIWLTNGRMASRMSGIYDANTDDGYEFQYWANLNDANKLIAGSDTGKIDYNLNLRGREYNWTLDAWQTNAILGSGTIVGLFLKAQVKGVYTNTLVRHYNPQWPNLLLGLMEFLPGEVEFVF